MTETISTHALPGQRSESQPEPFVRTGGRIVVGVDGSPASVQALRTAARIAELTGASIDAVGVWEMPLTGAFPQTGIVWAPTEETKAMLEGTLQDAFGDRRPVGMRTPACAGNPAKQILEQAQGADLIVLGSRGHGAFAGLVLGSVSIRCAAAATCPVLIVHAPPLD